MKFVLLLIFGILSLNLGCVGRAPLRYPPATRPPAEVAKPDLTSHLVGSWELKKDGKVRQMVFESDGRLVFKGALESFNGGRWWLDPTRKELKLLLSATPNRDLDIFHMYVGDGVKAFDRTNKEVTYAFDENTWSLNMAGWPYSKPDQTMNVPIPEPVLK